MNKKLQLVIHYKKYALEVFILIIVLLLLYYHFFYIIPYPPAIASIFSGRRQYIVLGIVGIFLAYYCMYQYHKLLSNNLKSLFWLISGYILCWMIETIFSWFYYQQDLASILSAGCRFLCIVYIIPFLVIFIRDKGINSFFKVLNVMSLIWCLILIYQSNIYRQTGKVLFDLSTYFYNSAGTDIRILNGNIRIGIYSFGNILFLYNFDRVYSGILKNKEKIFTLVCLIAGGYCIIFIQQTRLYIIIIAVCIAVIILSKKGNWKNQFLKVIFLIAVTAFIIYSPYVLQLIESFSVTGNGRWSTNARLYAISYYLKCIANNPIFGNGFTSDTLYYSLAHGNGLAQYSDVGFLGLFAETGLFSIYFYIVPLGRIISNLRYVKKKRGNITSFDKALFVFLLGTSATLIMTDQPRIISFAFIIAFYEFKRYQIKECK